MGFKEGLVASLTDYRYAKGAASRLGTKANQYFHKNIWHRFHSGEYLTEKEWDTLLILDGCRYDTFLEVYWLEGSCSLLTSVASETQSFMEANFFGDELHDTVYVSGNPYLYEIPDRTFHAVYSAVESGWDPDLETIPPPPILEMATDAHERHPR